jgi:integrase
MKPHLKIRPGKDKNGLSQIQLVYCSHGKVLRLDTKVRVQAFHFDGKQISSKCEDYQKMNDTLNRAELKLNNLLQKYRDEHPDVEPEIDTVRNLYNEEKQKYDSSAPFIDALEQWIPQKRIFVKPSTIKIYTTLLNDLKLLNQNKTLKFRDINEDFKNMYLKFLLNKGKDEDKPGTQNATILKRFQALNVFLNECPLNEYKFYKDFKIKLAKVKKQPVIIPSEDEFKSLLTYDFKVQRLSNARDLFCLSCLTGLRYSDIMNLGKNGLVKKNGKWYLKTIDKKTETFITIPLHSLAIEILQRLKFKITPISNQKLNQNLEDALVEMELFDYEDIKFEKRGVEDIKTVSLPKYKLMNFHAGRRFFITSLADGGVAVGNIKKWSGHNTDIIEQYISEKGYKEEQQMDDVFSKYNKKKE